jgi:hypothetical protein
MVGEMVRARARGITMIQMMGEREKATNTQRAARDSGITTIQMMGGMAKATNTQRVVRGAT